MQCWFKKNNTVEQTDGIAIRESAIHGRGVFSNKTFKAGAIIEIAPAVLLDQSERDFLQHTDLFSYYFVVSDVNNPVALGLGYTSLYNHAYRANAVYNISLKNAAIIIKACKLIKAGEEITLNYNGSPENAAPVYFLPEKINS